MKVAVTGKALRQQRRTDNPSILEDQAAPSLMREQNPGNRSHRQRICKTKQYSRHQRVSYGFLPDRIHNRSSFFNYASFNYARCSVTSNKSMALMPMKGTITPPNP